MGNIHPTYSIYDFFLMLFNDYSVSVLRAKMANKVTGKEDKGELRFFRMSRELLQRISLKKV